MTQKKICKICNDKVGKSNVCKECKEEFPRNFSQKGMIPFNRAFEKFKKDRKK